MPEAPAEGRYTQCLAAGGRFLFGVANNLFDSELEWRNTLLEELCANTRAQHRLRVFSPQSLRINPIATDGQINAVTDGNLKGLKAELLRLIRFENDI